MRSSPFQSAFLRSRRRFLRATAGSTLSATGIALASGLGVSQALGAVSDEDVEKDIRILNTAISAEHEAVAAYQLGAESGLLSKPVAKTAIAFQGHHKEHVEALTKAVRSLGGNAPEPKKDYDFPTDQLHQERDVLEFAAGLERGAVSAYAGAIPLFDNRQLSAAAASILADEAMHWAVLRSVLGLDPVPGAFFS